MPRHIFITEDNANDHISVFYAEPAFIVEANREDLAKLNLLDESKKPGVYILVGDGQRYVGQASRSVFSRLHHHDNNKSWWTKVIFFGREDGYLSKAQLDYLEATLINQFSDNSLKLENETAGNTSYINKMEKLSANTFLKQVNRVLTNVANIDLFENNEEPEINNDSGHNKIKFNDKIYMGKSGRQVFLDVMVDVLTSEEVESLSPIMTDEEPTATAFIGLEERISKNGVRLTKPIPDTSYYVYTCYSRERLQNRLEKMASLLGKEIEIQLD
ncbi:GIY-YIG nuclease family protein [Fructobacillus sp. M158]|uniref:GIY-YIG nuclease family protein n=1 Tax=Fructobacillus parabroussonetiae TaxID=2713174 RepID=UPI00200B02EB|nr:GIY-YIG nuclease family protein [Fructobacillus parabroussonetiae]MCK8617737.1 GIY-YIG nuclease family protein [Fructobacillus parabroussonetiae]